MVLRNCILSNIRSTIAEVPAIGQTDLTLLRVHSHAANATKAAKPALVCLMAPLPLPLTSWTFKIPQYIRIVIENLATPRR